MPSEDVTLEFDFGADPTEVFLTAGDIAKRYSIKVSTVNSWRFKRRRSNGPPFVRIGGNVRYPFSLLLKWETANINKGLWY